MIWLISDFKIFVDLDDNSRKDRLIEFYTDFKNYSLDETKKIIRPREHDEVEIIKKTKNYADVVYMSINHK
jgi:uridine kinase